MDVVWLLISGCTICSVLSLVTATHPLSTDVTETRRRSGQQHDPTDYYFVSEGATDRRSGGRVTHDNTARNNAWLEQQLRADLRADMRADVMADQRTASRQWYQPRLATNTQNLFQRRRPSGTWQATTEFSGNWRSGEDDEDYFEEEETTADEYYDPSQTDYFSEDDLNAVDRETIANNEDQIYRVKAEMDYEEIRMARMEDKMKAMERQMELMQELIDSKYPFGGYH